ncbi:MAG: hypothetical protein IPG81_12785 [Sandaracinaceae bacterium]|nr:hypothetical protein [Sandaracinaceae bacterium]
MRLSANDQLLSTAVVIPTMPISPLSLDVHPSQVATSCGAFPAARVLVQAKSCVTKSPVSVRTMAVSSVPSVKSAQLSATTTAGWPATSNT